MFQREKRRLSTMANGGQIKFGVSYDVDQSSLNKVKASLQELKNLTAKDLVNIDASKAQDELNKIKQSASELQVALQKSFNTDLGTLNVSKFNAELKNMNLAEIQQRFSHAGAAGEKAFKDIATQALTANMQLKQTSNFIDKIGTTMVNAVKWGIASSVMNNFSNSVAEAFGYIKNLDTSLNNIRIVTGQSSEEMQRFAAQASEAAASLGRQTREYTNAALTFYQQGLDEDAVRTRTEAVLKASNITGESASQMAEYLTAVWNGFKVEVGGEVEVVDKLAAVADSSASDMSELATAMSKVSSVASSMGVGVDQLSAQIATIVATTRDAPESVGNALKTIYARISDIKAGIAEDGATLGNYSGIMASLGFNVLDASGNLRNMGDVIEDVGNSWDRLTREQQIYLAQNMAGQRQFNKSVALFDNWETYTKQLNVAMNAEGTLAQKNAIAMESLAAHIKQLTAARERLISSFVDGDSFKGIIDSLTTILNLMGGFVESIGGGGTALTALGGIALRVFSGQISKELSVVAINFLNAKENAQQLSAQMDILSQFKGLGLKSDDLNLLISMKEEVLAYGDSLTEEEHNAANEIIRQTAELQNQRIEWEQNLQLASEFNDEIRKYANDKGAEGFDFAKLEGEERTKALQEIQQNLKKEESLLASSTNSRKTYTKDVRIATDAIRDYNSKKRDSNATSEKVQAADEKMAKALAQVDKSIIDCVEDFNLLAGGHQDVAKKMEEMQRAMEAFSNAIEPSERVAAANRVIAVYEEALKTVENRVQQTRDVVTRELDGASQKIAEATEASARRIKSFLDPKALQQNIDGVVKLAGAVTQLISIYQSFKQIGSLIEDEDLSTMDKAVAIIQNLIFVLASSQGLLKNFKDGWASLKNLVIQFGVASAKAAAGAEAASITTMSFGKAISTLASNFAAAHPVLLAFTAAIAALGIAFIVAKNYQERFDRVLDEANKKYDQTRIKIGEIKTAYEEVYSKINDYMDSANALNELEKGTKEWNDQLRECNNQVLELISTFPELGKYIQSVDGRLEISPEGLSEYYDSLNKQKAQLNDLANIQQQNIYSAENDKIIQDLAIQLGITHSQAEGLVSAIQENSVATLYSVDSINSLYTNSRDLAKVIFDHKDKIAEAITTLEANTGAIGALSENLMTSKLLDTEGYKNSRDQQAYAKLFNLQAEKNKTLFQDENSWESYVNQALDEDYSHMTEALASRDLGNIELGNELADKLAQILEVSSPVYHQNRDKEKDEFFDSFLNQAGLVEGAWEIGGNLYSLEELQEALATQQSFNKTLEETSDIEQKVSDLYKMFGDDANQVSIVLSMAGDEIGSFGSLGVDEMLKFRDQILKSKTSLTDFGEELANTLELSNEDLVGKVNQQIENANKKRAEWNNYVVTSNNRDILSTIDSGTIGTDTLSTLKKIGEKLEGNRAGLASTVNVIKQSGKDLGIVTEIINNNLDKLGQENGFTILANELKAAGIEVNFFDKEWQDFIKSSGAYEDFLARMADNINGLNTVITESSAGTKLTKQQFKDFNNALTEIYNSFGEASVVTEKLQADYAILTSEALSGTQEWIDALKRFREEAEVADTQLQFNNLQDKLSQLSKKIVEVSGGHIYLETYFNMDDFENGMAKLNEAIAADYQVEVSVSTDIESDLKDMGDARDQIAQLKSLMGQTSVSWESVKGVFSDLVAQGVDAVEVLEDGSIRCKDTAIQAAVEAKEAALKASADQTRGEIEDQNTRLKARINALQAQITSGKAYLEALEAQGEALKGTSEEEIKATTKQVNECKSAYEKDISNTQKVLDAKQTAGEEIANTAIESSTTQTDAIENVLKGDEALQSSAAEAAKNVSESVRRMAESTIANYDAMAAAKANAAKEIPMVSSGAKAVASVTGVTGKSISIGDLKALEYKGKTGTSIEKDLEEYNQNAKDNQDAIDKNTKEQEAVRSALAAAEAQLAGYQEALEKNTGELADLNSGNYANNAGERPAAAKGGKGGGGGGKGSKAKTPKEKKEKEKKEKEPKTEELFNDDDLDSTSEKFRDIDREIQKLTRDLDKLAKLQNRYLGSALVHNLNQQLKILKKQKSAYKEKLNIAKDELKQQKAKLEAQGVEIGKDGSIKNYTDALKEKQEQINKLTEEYNGQTAEGQENLKGQLDSQKQNYSKLKEQMNAYEQLNGQTIPEIEAQIEQIEQMIIELQIEKFNAVIELHIDWQEFRQEYAEFQKEIQQFRDQFASFYVDPTTGQRVRAGSTGESAKIAVQARRDAEKNAKREQADARAKYDTDTKRLKSKKGRQELAAEYGVSLTNKAERKAFQQWLANNYEQTLNEINQTRDAIYNKVEGMYRAEWYTRSTSHTQEEQEALKKELENINAEAASARAAASKEYADNLEKYKRRKKGDNQATLEEIYNVDLNDKKVRKTFKDTMLDVYQDTIKEIEQTRQDSLNGAIAAYDKAGRKIEANNARRLHDFGAEYLNQMQAIKKASDQLLNGDPMKNGGKTVSIIKDATQHVNKLADRIQRMNDNTKYDKEGNKIMGTDKLKVGDIDPLTGDRITSKKQLKAVKKSIGKDEYGEVYADMQSKIYEDGKKYAEYLEDLIKTLKDQAQEAFELWYAAIDKQHELIDDIIDEYQFITDIYNNQLHLLELINEKDSERYKALKSNLRKNREEEIAYIKERKAHAKEMWQQEDVNSEAYTKYWEEWKKLAQEYYNLQMENIEDIREEALEALDDIITKFDKAQTKGLGIDEFENRWEDSKELSDMYLNNVEKAYEIQALRAKYMDTINDTTDVTKQEKIRSIMEDQLDTLAKAEHLSQAEVDHANNLYNVMVKQLALEEAQQNKTKMRLRRDSQGNYTYQFVADQDDITKKQQEVNDALKKMNDDTTKALRENYNTQVEIYKEFVSKVRELKDEYLEGNITKEEYAERLNYELEIFKEKASINAEQNERLGELFKESQVLLLEGLAESEGMQQLLSDMNVSGAEATNIRTLLETIMGGNSTLLDLLGNHNLSDIIDAANMNSGNVLASIGDFSNLLGSLPQDMVDNTEQTIAAARELIEELLNQTQQVVDSIAEYVEQLIADMDADKDDVTEHIEQTKEEVSQLDEDIAELRDEAWKLQYINDILSEYLQDSLGKIYDVLLQIANEGEYGSESGQVQKGAQMTYGHKATSADVEAREAENLDKAVNTLKGDSENLRDSEAWKEAYNRAKNANPNADESYWTEQADDAFNKAAEGLAKSYDQVVEGEYTQDQLTQEDITTKFFKNSKGTKPMDPIDPDVLNYINEEPGRLQWKTKEKKTGYAKVYVLYKGKQVNLGYAKPENFVGYDTGGYTGDWSGSDGKLALLHKKEMVLNKDDTAKLLDATTLANNIAETLKTVQPAAATGSFEKAIGSNTLQQDVTITANFPNVQSSNEIERALKNLVNVAAQKASANRRAG